MNWNMFSILQKTQLCGEYKIKLKEVSNIDLSMLHLSLDTDEDFYDSRYIFKIVQNKQTIYN